MRVPFGMLAMISHDNMMESIEKNQEKKNRDISILKVGYLLFSDEVKLRVLNSSRKLISLTIIQRISTRLGGDSIFSILSRTKDAAL